MMEPNKKIQILNNELNFLTNIFPLNLIDPKCSRLL